MRFITLSLFVFLGACQPPEEPEVNPGEFCVDEDMNLQVIFDTCKSSSVIVNEQSCTVVADGDNLIVDTIYDTTQPSGSWLDDCGYVQEPCDLPDDASVEGTVFKSHQEAGIDFADLPACDFPF